MTGEAYLPYQHSSAWIGEAMSRTSEWIVQLDDRDNDVLHDKVLRARARGLGIPALAQADLDLGPLADKLKHIQQEVMHGRGFVQLEGFDMDRYSLEDAALAYWGLGMQMGTGAAQNAQGDLLGHVTNLGLDYRTDRRTVRRPQAALMFIDESHVTIGQVGGMYKGDRSRKENLVDYGFRLPSALDNRPLQFEEFEAYLRQTIFVSATPADYESRHAGQVVEQLVRPTGLIDPNVMVRPASSQVDDLLSEIHGRVGVGERVLVTTLTKRMAEDLTDFLADNGVKVRYLHSDIDTVERVEIIRDLRLGHFDVLVGINLLREGLDIPEVSLVAILDADKEGFLRSERSIVQTIGRAARHVHGTAILYADKITHSMQRAMIETERRRERQIAFNAEHGITPRGVSKLVTDMIDVAYDAESAQSDLKVAQQQAAYAAMDEKTVAREIRRLEKVMLVQVDDVAVRVAQHLDLDVARLLDILLDEDAVVAEAVAGFVAAAGEAFEGLLVVVRRAHRLAAAARAGLDHHRVADVLGDLHRVLGLLDRLVPAGDGADLRLPGQLLRRDLVAHRRDAVVLGADEDDAFFFAAAREVLVLAEEAVARVHGLRPGGLAGSDDLVGDEVTRARRRRAQQHGLVGEFHVPRVAVGLGIHRHGGDAQLLRGLDDAAGDLSAVCNQDLVPQRLRTLHLRQKWPRCA